MGHYEKGDVILAPVPFSGASSSKVRPCIVVAGNRENILIVCPVSSRPPSDAPCISLSLDDFSEGGLDLFGESFVITTHLIRLRPGDVIGKRGRLTGECITSLLNSIPSSSLPK